MRDYWDRILAAAPLNKEAATVTSDSKEAVGFRTNLRDQYLQDGPHSLRPPPIDPGFKDLTGQKFRTLTVRGLAAGFKQNSGGSAWAVRCDCGCYTVRRQRGLTKGNTAGCAECSHFEEVKAGKAYVAIKGGLS